MDNSYTVLNVEDLQPNRDLVRRILESRGYKVVDAETGMEGISKAIEIKPDLILMDINLPDLDGFSVVTRIRNHPQLGTVPIVALTARNVSDDAERAKAIGCDGYLSKPFGVSDLLKEVASRIGKPREEQDKDTRRESFLREHTAMVVEELERKFNELKGVHEELSAMHERLQRLDRAKTDFIHIAAHELRTPLTTVRAYTDMMRNLPKVSEDAMLKEMMNGLVKGVERLSSIIGDMVSIVRVELSTIDLAYTPLSLRTVIEPVLDDLGSAVEERNLVLNLNLPEDLPMILGDDTQLSQVFNRLMGNAIKYTPDHGTITVSAKIHEGPPPSELEDDDPVHKFVEISVADTGIGINKKDQSLIFEKFYTVEDSTLHSTGKTKFRGGGPGLGLTIAKGIVEAHNGRIWVESEGYDPDNNPGSTFYILLPAHTGEE